MIKLEAEVTTLSHAVSQAARIAPNKGAAHDRAAGIVLEVSGFGDESLVVKATNLEVTYRQNVNVLDVSGDQKDATWRLPADLLAGTMSHLPIEGTKVMLADKGDGYVYLVSGKTKAKFRQIVGSSYPEWEPFDEALLKPATDFAKRAQQVAWAVDRKDHGALGGVHMTGDVMVATNRAALAIAPCSIPVEAPVTAPLQLIAGLIRNTGEVLLRATDDQLQVMTDHDTQITSTLIAPKFPDYSGINALAFPHSFTFQRDPVVEAIQRVLVIVKAERDVPVMKFDIADGAITLTCTVPEVGTITEELAISGGTEHSFKLTPTLLLDALNGTDRSVITLDHGADPLKPFRLTDDDGYVAILTPRAA